MTGIHKGRPSLCPQGSGQVGGHRDIRITWAMDLLAPVEASAESTLSCSSVDGRVRRYDLRMGQLFSDYVGSECGRGV